MTRFLRSFPALALAAVALAASAEVGDREKPINFSADRGDLNYETKLGKLDGNVVLTQGTITVRADRLSFRQNADNSMHVTAFGNVLHVTGRDAQTLDRSMAGAAAASPHRFEPVESSLEDAFISMMSDVREDRP